MLQQLYDYTTGHANAAPPAMQLQQDNPEGLVKLIKSSTKNTIDHQPQSCPKTLQPRAEVHYHLM
jgi:hypothetical protein